MQRNLPQGRGKEDMSLRQ